MLIRFFLPSLLFDGEIITVCVMVALWSAARISAPLAPKDSGRYEVKTQPALHEAESFFFIVAWRVTEIRRVSWGFEGKKGEKDIHFWPLKKNTSLTHKEVKDFSLQTSDNHFDRASQLWPFSTFPAEVFEC